ncbi:predicted protein [Chaetomium globosum CBS 148.51]|uniref:Uncharacterized protein n=1 Tax=Chaetomium globosum (strain ATCC 6205 / CBS 148.51 / DSM 1962 / NBRC 6347 / NRRL 1970) TaxID=306901 RepID=Q2HF15_CHAGB|nr:uncharacterized protein CHGG_01189 [Chaetomium globosum CBS 148.51]EAQ92954.1 predicted protein [Chaetomium globosum CBS 148.51]
MAAGMTQAPFPPNQEGPVLDEQGSIDPDPVHHLGWQYPPGTSNPNAPTASNAPANVLWQEGAPLTSGVEPSLDFASLPYLPEYGNGTGDIIWDFSLGASNAGYGTVWPTSPTEAFVHNPWDLANQAFPSPASEAPSFNFALNPSGMDGPAGYQFTSTQSRTDSPTTAMNLILPTPLPQPADSSPKNPHPAPKRPAESPARPSRPRTLKRHRSDTPSIASIASISTPGSASTVGSATTTLGGVLPANVDPRVASEQIRREAWERCKAEANEMLQRRMMLMDHEHGALERETQRLQVNLSLMREAARREQAEEEEQVAKAGRAERWIDGE